DHGEGARDGRDIRLGVEMLPQPLQGELHRVSPPVIEGTSRARKPQFFSQPRSASKKVRRSGMPYFSMAMRSIPMPNAKPWYFAGSMPQLASTFGCTMAHHRV